MGNQKTFDNKCYDLAKHFLCEEAVDTEERRKELAFEIQQCVEDFIYFVYIAAESEKKIDEYFDSGEKR